MKTDDLVAALSMHIDPVNRRWVDWAVCIALAAGTIAALGIVLVGFGVRSHTRPVSRSSTASLLKFERTTNRKQLAVVVHATVWSHEGVA